MRFLHYAAIVIVTGCGKPAPPPVLNVEPTSSPTAQAPSVGEARNDAFWIGVIRRGGAKSYVAVKDEEIEGMMSRQFTKGKTTLAEVFQFFGDPSAKAMGELHNLDRPKRDGVEAYQYTIWDGDPANWNVLYMEFDAQTKVLLDWGISGSICGFCPHIFTYDGTWRLEGKMLAGRVGAIKSGFDTMVLPRLVDVGGEYSVKLKNLAPETEYISSAELATVPLESGEEMDLLINGDPIAWRPESEIPLQLSPAGETEMPFPATPQNNLLVLELRNTADFEQVMRDHFLYGTKGNPGLKLTVDFGVCSYEIDPVGTKFLRRIAIEIPPGALAVKLSCSSAFWYMRRVWVGRKREDQPRISWARPSHEGSLQLNYGEESMLRFVSGIKPSAAGKLGFALRLEGYYEFIKAR